MRSQMFHRLEQYARWREDVRSGMTPRRKIVWTLGNLLIFIGLLLFLFVGGTLADERYNVYAASGDNDVMAPVVASEPGNQDAPSSDRTLAELARESAPAPVVSRAAPRFDIPILNNGSADALTNAVPQARATSGPSTITRIVAPAIALDKKVIEVGWTVQLIDGQEVAVWDVDKYRVGHHQGSSNPGDGGNIVLAGHSGGYAYPFNDIYYLKPDDVIELYANDQVYEYRVSDHILVDEVGQPLEKRLENAQYIEPTGEEMITMVACWPLTGPNKFNQRIIIRARPVGGTLAADQSLQEHSGWTAR